ncbi:hypothetical protein HZA98_04670 [Candidatus Woesearchaeota archaeon]|nr:hypothetical protein [Candidatus Woesearchaeota archaeon]
MAKKKRRYITEYIKIFPLLFLGILIFTFLDFLIHSLSQNLSVPEYYFRNKIIFATIYACIIYFFVRKMQTWKQALITTSIIAILLQIRYFYEGYNLQFVIEFLFIHWGILFLVLWITYIFGKKVLRKKPKTRK